MWARSRKHEPEKPKSAHQPLLALAVEKATENEDGAENPTEEEKDIANQEQQEHQEPNTPQNVESNQEQSGPGDQVQDDENKESDSREQPSYEEVDETADLSSPTSADPGSPKSTDPGSPRSADPDYDNLRDDQAVNAEGSTASGESLNDASNGPQNDADSGEKSKESILKNLKDSDKTHRQKYVDDSPKEKPRRTPSAGKKQGSPKTALAVSQQKSPSSPKSPKSPKPGNKPKSPKVPPPKVPPADQTTDDDDKAHPKFKTLSAVTLKLLQPGKKRRLGMGDKQEPEEKAEEEKEVKPEVKKEKEKETPWWELFYDYTQNATVHGIKYITDRDTYCFRKFIWMIIFSVCCAYVTYQVQQRIRYYLSEPVMVKVEVNFNQSLRFPTVALCNQNTFRVTEAVRLGYTEIIYELFDRNNTPISAADFDKHSISKIDVGKMYGDLSHRREDMIVKCAFGNIPCGPENFTMKFTDHGVCLMFNVDADKVLMAKKTGQDNGLHLQVNVEQYEYMPGPHSSAGLRVMLYDRDEYPLVDELGYAVSPGTRSFVAMEVLVMERLDIPRGSCRPKTSHLQTLPVYSDKACRTEVLTRHVYKRCGCRARYLPAIADAPVCSIQQYFSCAKREIENFGRSAELGDCPPSCTRTIYNPTFSYLTSASHDIDKILDITNQTKLLEQYVKARDATQAVDKRWFQIDMEYLKNVLEQNEIVHELLNQNLSEIAVGNYGRVIAMLEFSKTIMEKINQVYKFQHFVLEKNFFAGAVEFDSRTLSPLTSDFSHYVGKFERDLMYLQSLSNKDAYRSVRELLFNMLKNEIDTKKNMTDMALEELKTLRLAYEEARPLVNDSFANRTQEEHIQIAPLGSLYHSVNEYEAYTTLDDLQSELKSIRRLFSRFDALLSETFNKSNFNVRALRNSARQHHNAVQTVNQIRTIAKTEIFKKPLLDLEKKMDKFNFMYDKLKSQLKKIMVDLKLLNSTISMKGDIFDSLEETVNMSGTYISREGWRKTGKSELCEHLDKPEVLHSVVELKKFVDNMLARAGDIKDGWKATIFHFVNFIEQVVDDKDTYSADKYYVQALKFYNDNSSNGFLSLVLPVLESNGKLGNFSSDFEEEITEIGRQGDLGGIFGSKVYDLISAAEQFKTRCDKYLDGNKLDEQFYRDNFLWIELYFSELSYELIQQMPAFTIFDLLSDVGGSLGLFIGASVISAFELLDLFLFNFIKKRRIRNEDGRTKAERIYEGKV